MTTEPGANAPEDVESEVDTADLFAVLTKDLPAKKASSSTLAEKLAAIDAGRLPVVYDHDGGDLAPVELDCVLAGLIETAEYEGDSALFRLGAEISTLSEAEPDRARKVSVLIEKVVSELEEEARSNAPTPKSAADLSGWPTEGEAEVLIEPTGPIHPPRSLTPVPASISTADLRIEAIPTADVVRPAFSTADIVIEDPIEAPRRDRFQSLEIPIDEVAPEFDDSAELQAIEAVWTSWTGRSAMEIFGGRNDEELRAFVGDFRDRYSPKDFDAPTLRRKKQELLGRFMALLAQYEELRPKKLAKLALKRVSPGELARFAAEKAPEPPPPMSNVQQGIHLIQAAKTMVKGAQYELAAETLRKAATTAPALVAIVEVWLAYVSTLVNTRAAAVTTAIKRIELELQDPLFAASPAAAEAYLILGRLFRRAGLSARSHEALRKAFDLQHQGAADSSVEARRVALSTIRESSLGRAARQAVSGKGHV